MNKTLLAIAGALATLAVATPSYAAGPVAGVAGVRTIATAPTCENGSVGNLDILKSTNTASYSGYVTVNGVVVRNFTLTKEAITINAFNGVVTEPTVVKVLIRRGGLGSVSQSTTFQPAVCP